MLILPLIFSIAGLSAETKQKERDVPSGYTGVQFGDEYEKVKNVISAQGIEIISDQSRSARKFDWVDLEMAGDADGKKKGDEKPKTRERREGIVSFDEAAEIKDQDDRVKKQRVLIAIKFFGKTKTRSIYTVESNQPKRIYYNYVMYYFFFTSDEKVYKVALDMTRLQLLDFDYNYLYNDLVGTEKEPKYGQPYKEEKQEARSGTLKLLTYTYHWMSKDKNQSIEARVVVTEKPDAIMQFSPVYVAYTDVNVGKEYLNESQYNFETNTKTLEKLKL